MNKSIEKFSPDTTKDGKLKMSPITLYEDYAKEWNENKEDFYMLTRNGEPINGNLYRSGMFRGLKEGEDYSLLLKYTEAIYDKKISEDPKRRKYLKSEWVIINKEGEEKFVHNKFDSIYLVSNSIIYHIGSKYYNIETGELYCNASGSAMVTSEFLFLNNPYDKNKERRGVLQINKKSGEYKLFPE